MTKAIMIFASLALVAGTAMAKTKRPSAPAARSGDHNISRDNKADCGRLQQTDLFANTNPPKSDSVRAGDRRAGRQ